MNNNLKFTIKRVLSIVLALLLLVPIVGPKRAMAEGIELKPIGNAESFINNLPIEEITAYIDKSKIYQSAAQWSSNIDNVDEIQAYEEISNPFKAIVYKVDNVELNQELILDGTVEIIYPNAAVIKEDGSRADVKVTLSNITIEPYISEDSTKIKSILIYRASGMLGTGTYDSDNALNKADINNNATLTAKSITTKIEIVKDNTPLDVKFYYGTKDIDLPHYTSSTESTYDSKFAESIEPLSGYGDIYVTDNTLLKYDDKYDTIRGRNSDSDTWNSGYMTLCDGSFDFIWRAAGVNVNTPLFQSVPIHLIKDRVIGGGVINRVVDDKEVKEENVFAKPGSSVGFVARPNEGHKIKKVTVVDKDGKKDVTPEDKLSDFNYTFENIDKDYEIIVEYEPFSYKINYDANGGEGEMTSDTFIYTDETMKSKDNAFTKQDEHFVGFKALDKDGNPLKDKDGNELPLFKSADDFKEYLVKMGDGAEITLQAQWEPDEYTIKYDPNGGEGTMTDQHFSSTDKEAKSKPNAFTAGGFDFMGFKAKDKDGNYLKDKDGNDLVFANPADFISYLKKQGNGGEITLVAQWKKKEYKLPIPKTGVE